MCPRPPFCHSRPCMQHLLFCPAHGFLHYVFSVKKNRLTSAGRPDLRHCPLLRYAYIYILVLFCFASASKPSKAVGTHSSSMNCSRQPLVDCQKTECDYPSFVRVPQTCIPTRKTEMELWHECDVQPGLRVSTSFAQKNWMTCTWFLDPTVHTNHWAIIEIKASTHAKSPAGVPHLNLLLRPPHG